MPAKPDSPLHAEHGTNDATASQVASNAFQSFNNSAIAPLAVSLADGAKIAGFGRTFLYELMAIGELPFVRIGKRRLLLVSDLADLLQRYRCGGAGR